jgi:argininosuccinate synthase
LLNSSNKSIKQYVGALEIVNQLNKLGIKHGIGNTDIVETRVNGLKNHGIYQNPGAFIISECHHHMEMLCLDKEVLKLQYNLANELSYIVYEGF